MKFGLLPDGYLVFSGKDSWRHLFFHVFYISFIAKIVCAHSANALRQMAIQLPKLRVAVRPHHVQIPVSRSLAVTTSHPPKVGRRSQKCDDDSCVFCVFKKIERKSPASLSFSGSQRLLLLLFRMRRQFRCRMGMVPQRIFTC